MENIIKVKYKKNLNLISQLFQFQVYSNLILMHAHFPLHFFMHFSRPLIPLCSQQRTTVTWRVCLLRAQRNRIDCGKASASASAAAVAASAHYFSPLRAWPRAEGASASQDRACSLARSLTR